MSDFTNGFWSIYVAGVTIIGIFACLLLLWITSNKKVKPTGDNTTGHVWDGDLTEMDNPMPRWWMWMFVLTIIFGIGYLITYPGLGAFKGRSGWSQVGAYESEVTKATAALEPIYARFAGMNTEQIAGDGQAMAIGERLFMNNCAQCHGSDARGSKSFPNLTDNDWLHGGEPEQILKTIREGRVGIMAPLATAVGTPEDVRNLAHYVLSLSNSPHDSLRASLGKSKFALCAACHGTDGKGNTALGAPNLTDDIWLHGWGEAAIVEMITNGKMNEMPAQVGKLTDAQINVLAAYIWGLSNKSGSATQ